MKYHFEIKTADQYLAGTDANIFVRLYGERGISKNEIRLNGYISDNAFERDQHDYFDVTLNEDLGDIYMIDVRSDNKYGGAGWLCSYFKITRKAQNEKGEEVSGPTVTFSLPSGEWIEDTKVHTYKATDGFPVDVPEHKEQLMKIVMGTHFVPANIEMQLTCENKVSVNIEYSQVNVMDNTTKAAVEVTVDAIQAAVENELKLSLSKQMSNLFGTTFTRTNTVTVPPADHPRAYQEIWYETRYTFAAKVGEDTYSFSIPTDRLFYGLEEVNLTEQMMKIVATH